MSQTTPHRLLVEYLNALVEQLGPYLCITDRP